MFAFVYLAVGFIISILIPFIFGVTEITLTDNIHLKARRGWRIVEGGMVDIFSYFLVFIMFWPIILLLASIKLKKR